ncbi:PREDICTED: location of vulva defective 1-like [Atta colombica]|uniref:location of vulva defective 1-like n=1 Tax=Atta colombica TaxID=520822 RepID=UPI00084CC9DF|nr:PREDICTED: location of vulva defective 1-like [Atta colombica]
MTIVTERWENTANDINLNIYKRLIPVERQIFNFKKNGIKIDLKVVPSAKNDSVKNKNDDYFPEFPVKDIGKCIIKFSLDCIKKRFIRFIETVSHLDEITLLGQNVKLVKTGITRRSNARSMNDSDVSIERSVDDFFDSFTLRITLPRWNKQEKNQIDMMFDETAVAEGRGKKGGGGGCGGGKGGKCKMMMMGMMMMLKMKLIGLMSLKSMMMGGMSLMVSMMMLMSKFGKGGGGGGGPWKGGGGGGGGGGDYKEIILLTKSAGGGGGGGGHSSSYGAPPPSSYGAPPSSSYGSPSGGGGYGGGGWGRSFHNKRPMIYDKETKTEIADGFNHIPMTGEVISNAESIDYLDYQDYQEPSSITNSSSRISNWNTPSYSAFQDGDIDVSIGSAKNNLKSEAIVNAEGRSFIFNETPPISIVNVIEKTVDTTTTTEQSVTPEFAINAVYMDEWQATAEKTNSNVLSTNSNEEIKLQQTELRPKNIPLLHKI